MRPEIKICGLRRPEDAAACSEAGADFAGLNLVPGVRRAVASEALPALLEALPPVRPVLVVRDPDFAELGAISRSNGIRWVQLHGRESLEDAERLGGGVRLVRALTAGDLDEPARVEAWAPRVARFLVDGRRPGLGVAWDWGRLGLDEGRLFGVPVWVAGGLSPENVREAMRASGAAGADVASGIERNGLPDAERIQAFCAAARGALEQEQIR